MTKGSGPEPSTPHMQGLTSWCWPPPHQSPRVESIHNPIDVPIQLGTTDCRNDLSLPQREVVTREFLRHKMGEGWVVELDDAIETTKIARKARCARMWKSGSDTM
jgi:transposase